ncbi:hypothetical protein [Brevundimonas sp. G8]|uniref:hypothetical protein n=1 Tax=Brevundimonas sp. G8 TaxID=1350776 RepID=UPI00135A9FCB|nr:hypothetical protein [Brevundimonas sp. G8]
MQVAKPGDGLCNFVMTVEMRLVQASGDAPEITQQGFQELKPAHDAGALLNKAKAIQTIDLD